VTKKQRTQIQKRMSAGRPVVVRFVVTRDPLGRAQIDVHPADRQRYQLAIGAGIGGR